MLPDPLHPAVVHLPIGLAIVLPILALLLLGSIRRGLLAERTWIVVVLLQALLAGSAWLALETGEDQEERVERVVAERHIEAHEEAAERFAWIAGLGILAVGAGMLPERAGLVGRIVGTLATVGALAAAVSAGHSGGELVYEHGAASAYVEAGQGAAPDRSARHSEDD